MYFGSRRILEVDYSKQQKDSLFYEWNRQLDFNEWFDDVYLTTNKECGTHKIKELWELFEINETKQDNLFKED